MTILRPQQLPPEIAGTYNTNISGTTTVDVFELDRGAYNGVVVYVKADQNLLIHVDAGTLFSGSPEYLNRRTHFARAGVGFQLPVEVAAEKVRISVENPGASATTEIHVAVYLVTVNGISVFQHPLIPLWTNQTLTAGAADIYSPVVDLRNSMGGQAFLQVTNGATGPTAGPKAWLQASSDGTNFGDYCAFGLMTNVGSLDAFPTTNNAVTRQSVHIPHSIAYARIRAGGNTGQAVTVTANANLAHY